MSLLNINNSILTQYVNPKEVMIFTTNKNGTFSPSIVVSDKSIAIWTVDGYGTQTTNTPSFNMIGNVSNRVVTLKLKNLNKITKFYAYSQNIVGKLDISKLKNVVDFRVNSNPLLTSIINPISSQIFTFYYAYSCKLTGTLDLSGLTKLGGDFRVYSNPLLTSIINPTSNQTFTIYRAYSCNLTGTLDVSTLTGLGGRFSVIKNPLLTTIINPITTKVFINWYASSSALGVVDWSNLNGSQQSIYIEDNNMSCAEVDENMVGIDTNLKWGTTKVINIAGNNGILTDGSVTGFNGIAAKDRLIAKGVSVTFN